jgi:hypothetical protein
MLNWSTEGQSYPNQAPHHKLLIGIRSFEVYHALKCKLQLKKDKGNRQSRPNVHNII